MKQEFKMTQKEMDDIIAINKNQMPVMKIGNIITGMDLQEKINAYWAGMGEKYGFKHMTVEPSDKGKLYFLAEPKPVNTESSDNHQKGINLMYSDVHIEEWKREMMKLLKSEIIDLFAAEIIARQKRDKTKEALSNEVLDSANHWIPFRGCDKVDFGFAAMDNCQIKFEDGSVRRYNDKWPALVLTHYKHN